MDGDASGSTNRDTLRGFVERVAFKHDERDILTKDVAAIYREAKDAGIDTGILREVVREYRANAEARNARYQLLNEYRAKLGMLDRSPLGDAAADQEDRRYRGHAIDEAIDRARQHLDNGPDWAA